MGVLLVSGAIEFLQPWLLPALFAAGIPIAIHLAMRSRPRRQVFPALQFLLESHPVANRAHRLKHLLLMLCRMAVIALLVLLLMEPLYVPPGAEAAATTGTAEGPISVVLAFDDSASMGYRYQGRTRIDAALEAARQLMDLHGRFPPGSEFVVLSASSGLPSAFTADPMAIESALRTVRVRDHSRDARLLLDRAVAALSRAQHRRREIYLFTDLAQKDWAGSVTLPPEVERLIVFDLGPRENLNNVVSVSGLTSTPMPEGQPVPLALQVRTGDAPLEGTLHVHVDGVPRVRHVLPRIDANTRSLQELVLPPLDRGIHRIEVVLEPQDPLLIDNRRYAHVLIDRRPRVLLLHGERPGDLPTMVEAMLAPPGLDPIHTRFEVQRAESTALGRVELRELLAVLLVDVPELDDSVSRALAAYARAGGLVLIIPGDQVNPADYERCADLLGLRVAGIDDLEPGIRTAVDDFTHPYLRPFGEAGVDSLNDREAFRRLRIEALAAGARPVIRFGDGAPALVENRLGSGTVLTLAFSPAREWGQYGTQAAPTIVLLNTILESHIPRSDRVARYEAGQIASANLAADARVRMPDGSTAPLRFAGPRATLPTDSAGLYAVLDKSGNEIVLSYAVNLSDEESDLAPIERAEFLKRFPAGLVTVVSQVSDLQTLASASAGATSLWVPFALAVLVLLMLESAFSNRFYGFGPPAPDSGLDDAN